MPVTKYQYLITDTFNSSVNATQLELEIGFAIPLVPVEHIDVGVEPGKCDVYMSDALTPADQAILAGTIGAHQGVGYAAQLMGTVQALAGEKAIVDDLSWDELHGVVTTPKFFWPDVTQIIARIIGQHKGDGGQIRFLEDVDGLGTEEKVNPFHDLPDTAGAWQRFKVDSNVVPRDGLRNIYTTLVRRNGAASLELRYMTISMIVVRAF